jgi:hypothetical protein
LDFILRPMPEEQIVVEPGAGPQPVSLEEGPVGRQKAILQRHKGITLDDLAPPLAEKKQAPTGPKILYNPPPHSTPPPPKKLVMPPPTKLPEAKPTTPAPQGHQIEIITGSEHRTVTVPEPGI